MEIPREPVLGKVKLSKAQNWENQSNNNDLPSPCSAGEQERSGGGDQRWLRGCTVWLTGYCLEQVDYWWAGFWSTWFAMVFRYTGWWQYFARSSIKKSCQSSRQRREMFDASQKLLKLFADAGLSVHHKLLYLLYSGSQQCKADLWGASLPFLKYLLMLLVCLWTEDVKRTSKARQEKLKVHWDRFSEYEKPEAQVGAETDSLWCKWLWSSKLWTSTNGYCTCRCIYEVKELYVPE